MMDEIVRRLCMIVSEFRTLDGDFVQGGTVLGEVMIHYDSIY